VQLDAGDLRDQPIRDPRGQKPPDRMVVPFLAPTADDIVPFLKLRHQHGNIGRVILEIGVHRHDHAAPGVGKTGAKGRCLAEVLAKPNDPHPRIDAVQLGENVEALIRTAVVDENDLVLAMALQRRDNLLVERAKIVLLVKQRDHHRKCQFVAVVCHRSGILKQSIDLSGYPS
jgi:hypothetical protein